MHVVPTIDSSLKHKRRLDSFDRPVAVRRAVRHHCDGAEVVAKGQPEEHVPTGQPNRSVEGRKVWVESQGLTSRFSSGPHPKHVRRAVRLRDLENLHRIAGTQGEPKGSDNYVRDIGSHDLSGNPSIDRVGVQHNGEL